MGWDEFYMRFARAVAEQSKADKRKVGAVLVKGDNIISFGYNGTVSGDDNGCEDILGDTLPNVIHAEHNAILKAAKSTISTTDSTLYVTCRPCERCAPIVVTAGISRVVFDFDIECDWMPVRYMRSKGIVVDTIGL